VKPLASVTTGRQAKHSQIAEATVGVECNKELLNSLDWSYQEF
jgi:hypothetical protein